MKFSATLLQGGKTATGIHVPDEIIESLGGGRRPAVKATVNGYEYRTTVGIMNGNCMLPFSADHRAASGIAAGDDVEVDIELDTQPRTVELPDEFAKALEAEPSAKAFFETISPSNKKWHVTSITDAKTEETRQRRIAKQAEMLREGRAR